MYCVTNVLARPLPYCCVLTLLDLFVLFRPILGEVLVPTHLFYLGGNNHRYLHTRLTHHPHQGNTPTVSHFTWYMLSCSFLCVSLTHFFLNCARLLPIFTCLLCNFLVLLCYIEQQVFQRYRACPRSDYGECAFFDIALITALGSADKI